MSYDNTPPRPPGPFMRKVLRQDEIDALEAQVTTLRDQRDRLLEAVEKAHAMLGTHHRILTSKAFVAHDSLAATRFGPYKGETFDVSALERLVKELAQQIRGEMADD